MKRIFLNTYFTKKSNKALQMSSFTYSVYIPRVFKNITQEEISRAFECQDLGRTGRVDILKVFNEKGLWVYNKAFVHFNEWFANEKATNLRDTIEAKKGQGKLFYDQHDSKFWMLLPNHSAKVPEQPITPIESEQHPHFNGVPMLQHPAQGYHYPMMQPFHYGPGPMFNLAPQPPILQRQETRMYDESHFPRLGAPDRYYSNYTAEDHARNKNKN